MLKKKQAKELNLKKKKIDNSCQKVDKLSSGMMSML